MTGAAWLIFGAVFAAGAFLGWLLTSWYYTAEDLPLADPVGGWVIYDAADSLVFVDRTRTSATMTTGTGVDHHRQPIPVWLADAMTEPARYGTEADA